MLFNSVTYLFIFLPLVVVVYWISTRRLRLWLILIASLTFYGFWRIEFVPLLLFSAVIDYLLALRIDDEKSETKRLWLLRLSIVINLFVLGVFKYLAFFRDSIWSIAEHLGYQPTFTELNIILPLGISFYIFQTMSYTIDVYRRELKAEHDLLTYTCFVTFFPQLVAGPILRAAVLIPQLNTQPAFDSDKLRMGIERIIAGLFLKVVLADTVAGLVDSGFQRDASSLLALDNWTLSFLFGFQIYFDFAGYSAIAIGSALLLGFVIPENFNFPYAATSPRDFWRRWHISLSTWIRDYLYLPLIGGYRRSDSTGWDTAAEGKVEVSKPRKVTGLFLTWGIMGLWHGANWTFVVWGLYHAAIVQAHRLLIGRITLPNGILGWLLSVGVTLIVMMAGWIPFRAETVSDALTMWQSMLSPSAYSGLSLSFNSYLTALLLVIAVSVRWVWISFIQVRVMKSAAMQFGLSTAYHAVTLSFVFLFLQVKQQFIYFQF